MLEALVFSSVSEIHPIALPQRFGMSSVIIIDVSGDAHTSTTVILREVFDITRWSHTHLDTYTYYKIT